MKILSYLILWQLRIKFIEHSGSPIRALGDKIGRILTAQSSGVSCIAWNGSDEYNRETGCLPQDMYDKANVTSMEETEEAVQRVGFSVVTKVSEGNLVVGEWYSND